MNDAALAQPNRSFDIFLLLFSLLIVLILAALLQQAGWQGGFLTAQAIGNQLPGVFWQSVTTLGDERVLLALMMPFCLRYPRVFWAIVVASLLGGLASRGLKVYFALPRPAAVIDAAQITIHGARLTSQSFPSGHSISVFAFAVGWAALLGWRRALPLLFFAALTGFSRVAVGAHWPTDVLGGALVGTLSAGAGVALTRRFHWGLRVKVHWALMLIAAVAVATLPFESQGYPGSLAFRIGACAVGLAAFLFNYVLPLWRDGWQVASRPIALVWQGVTKA